MSKPFFISRRINYQFHSKITEEQVLKQKEKIDQLTNDAVFYCVDHIAGSTVPESILYKIIQKLKAKENNTLTIYEKNYLKRQNLLELYDFVEGKLSFSQFKINAQIEKAKYLAQVAEEQLQESIRLEQEKIQYERTRDLKRKAYEKEIADKRKQRESDPNYIRKQQENILLRKYGIDIHNSRSSRKKILNILQTIDNKQRLQEVNIIWLNTKGQDFFTNEVRIRFHQIEADFYMKDYDKNGDLWSAINASSHFRKCQSSREAEKLLERVDFGFNKKVLSAYFTTLGGTKRDLKLFESAINNGLAAHELVSQDYRPCTLLGAVYIEMEQYNEGHEWYQKARERGVPDTSINSDLKKILFKLDKIKRREMVNSLIKQNKHDYGWLKSLIK